MSGPEKFLRFEVGDPSPDDGSRGMHVTRYGESDKVSPRQFGVESRSVPHPDAPEMSGLVFRQLPASERFWLDAPVATLVVCQPFVYRPHVVNLASVPSEALVGDTDPVSGVLVGERVFVEHGAHRAVAAKVRGDVTVPVFIAYTWLPE